MIMVLPSYPDPVGYFSVEWIAVVEPQHPTGHEEHATHQHHGHRVVHTDQWDGLRRGWHVVGHHQEEETQRDQERHSCNILIRFTPDFKGNILQIF